MDDNERRVREAWNSVYAGAWEDYHWVAILHRGTPYHKWQKSTISEAWAAAWQFTEERLEEIRQLEVDIAFMSNMACSPAQDVKYMANCWVPSVVDDGLEEEDDPHLWYVHNLCSISRILQLLKSTRATLRVGMKEQGK